MEANEPNTQDVDELGVVGVDGSASTTRVVEIAAKDAPRWGALQHVVSVLRRSFNHGRVTESEAQ
jgi:hypothetical protein